MWQTLRKEEIIKKLNTNEKTGLEEREVLRRQEQKERKYTSKIYKTI